MVELLQHRREGDREREGGQGEVEPGEPQGGDAEEEPAPARDQPGQRDRPQVADVVMADHDRGRVAADRHERSVAERDLARVPGQDVQAEDRDEVDADVRDLRGAEVAQPVRQDEQDAERSEEPGRLHRERDHAARRHTRLTVVRPNRPVGFTSSTARITMNATGSFSASPTKST